MNTTTRRIVKHFSDKRLRNHQKKLGVIRVISSLQKKYHSKPAIFVPVNPRFMMVCVTHEQITLIGHQQRRTGAFKISNLRSLVQNHATFARISWHQRSFFVYSKHGCTRKQAMVRTGSRNTSS